ncbi:MAG: type II toxin-antitoxin system RelE/ParE family toxin [Gammaproteobacteria bacterium]|jgi:plasmid stabilization system protein ParE
MTRRVIIRSEAVDDLNAAFDWYENENPGLGREFAVEISYRIDKIGESPLLYADIGNGIRRILASKFPFAVYYLTTEQNTVVLAVLHCARDPKTWKKRK